LITRIHIRNFKGFEDVSVELGPITVLIGPNNSGKTTALQALALWELGLRVWNEKRSGQAAPEKRPGVTINRRDLISIPVPDTNLLWRALHVRQSIQSGSGKGTQNVRIEILVEGVSGGEAWQCGFEFDYANSESLYCRPIRTGVERMPVPDAAREVRVAFLPPMSGLSATEDFLAPGAINVRIGEGRTAEVLRNLCFKVAGDEDGWQDLSSSVEELFGVRIAKPEFIAERGQITMTYSDRGIKLDLASAGRGLQQTLLLLAHTHTHPGTVLLLDEPDAHLEILRQRQIYRKLSSTAERHGTQIVAASHSEVILNEAADRDVVVAFVGRPHRIDDRGSQVSKALKSIGYEQYVQAEQTGWVLYLEGATDLAVLQAFATRLGHPAMRVLSKPFVSYAGNVPSKVQEHFFGLREAKSDLAGIAIYDRLGQDLRSSGGLVQMQWEQREVENYLCFEETLLNFSDLTDVEVGSLFEAELRSRQREAMTTTLREFESALRTLNRPDPYGSEIKASDDFLDPLFAKYYERLGTENLMRKRDYHVLVDLVPEKLIAGEVKTKLDAIVEVAGRAKGMAEREGFEPSVAL